MNFILNYLFAYFLLVLIFAFLTLSILFFQSFVEWNLEPFIRFGEFIHECKWQHIRGVFGGLGVLMLIVYVILYPFLDDI